MLDFQQAIKRYFTRAPQIRKAAEFTAAQTSTIIWAPPTGKRVVITDLVINWFSATVACVTTVFENTDAAANWVWKGEAPMNAMVLQHVPLLTPFVGVTDGTIRLTTSGAVNIRVFLFGYETMRDGI